MIQDKISIVGDVMLDRYIHGETQRISPEAPVPIVKIETDYCTLGGAANVAHNLANLGNRAVLFGAIGNDESGRLVKDLLALRNIEDGLFTSEDIATTTKTRIVSRNQQMLRIDKENWFEHNPKSLEFFKNQFGDANLIVVSDYEKGFCSDDLFDLLFTSKSRDCKVLIDPKGKNWEKYNGAFIVKPNLAEMEDICGAKIENSDDVVLKYGKDVFEKYNFDHLIITRGSKGMTHVFQDGYAHYNAKKVEVYDVSGAGDTAMAVLAYMINLGKNVHQAITAANLASSYVVTKPTTYAINSNELENLLKS